MTQFRSLPCSELLLKRCGGTMCRHCTYRNTEQIHLSRTLLSWNLTTPSSRSLKDTRTLPTFSPIDSQTPPESQFNSSYITNGVLGFLISTRLTGPSKSLTVTPMSGYFFGHSLSDVVTVTVTVYPLVTLGLQRWGFNGLFMFYRSV